MTSVESLSKALRDFAYAVQEDVRDAALAVASDLAAERKRREGLEDELHLERLAHTAAVTRAEQAERERDSERLTREGSQQHRLEVETRLKEAAERNLGLIDRAELAEADNAALLALATERGCLDLGPTVDGGNPGSCNEQGWPDAGSCHACRATRTAHPGAAMLERMRAMEKLLRRAVDDPGCMDEHWLENVVRALKETP